MMKQGKKLLAVLALLWAGTIASQAQDTLWVKFDNRFAGNKSYAIDKIDSVAFRMNERTGTFPVLQLFNEVYSKGYTEYRLQTLFGNAQYAGTIMFGNPGRILWRPSTYQSNDYQSDASRWSFQRSMESEHFVVFWEKGFGQDPTRATSYRFNPKTLLQQMEKVWDVYVGELGFLVPGRSTTDTYKIPTAFATGPATVLANTRATSRALPTAHGAWMRPTVRRTTATTSSI